MSPLTGSRSVRTSGQAGADLGALDRVVVEEDEAVEPEVQLPRERADVLRFRLPVDPPGDQVLALEDHVRPTVEDLEDVGLDVLAAQAEQEPLARQLGHEPLEGPPGRRDGDAVDPLLADDPLPERVVAVEDDDLVRAGPAARGSDGPGACPSRRRTRACRGCGPAGRAAGRGNRRPGRGRSRAGRSATRRARRPARRRSGRRPGRGARAGRGSARAAGESGQRATIRGVPERAAAPRAASIRSAAFRSSDPRIPARRPRPSRAARGASPPAGPARR